MPSVRDGESEQDYVSRCIPIVLNEGTAKDQAQAAAICYSMYREHKGKSMSPHEQMLMEIKARSQKQAAWNEGILTADRYVQTLMDCCGSELCYRYASKGNISFSDAMKRASNVLTYNNPDMVVEDNYSEFKKSFNQKDMNGFELELPKNTLMVFKHVLTTPRKDRDGDKLHPEGGRPDPRMLMLWQHTHTLPIGKMLGVAEQNTKTLNLYSAIVDINELAHDAAVMIENKMGRFSHGFKALDFEKAKEEDGRTTSGGFDVKQFEIMEESLVSVPANTDAVVEEVIYSLVSSGKMTSPLMKSYGQSLKEKRPVSVNVPHSLPIALDLKVTVNGQPIGDHEHEPVKAIKCSGKEGCSCGCGKSAPEEADGAVTAEKEHAEAEEMKCPKCGGKMVGGICEECGYGTTEEKKVAELDEKAGRVLNSRNHSNLQQAHENIEEVHHTEHLMIKGGKALCKEAHRLIGEVLDSHGKTQSVEEGKTVQQELTLKDAMAKVIADATYSERQKMIETLASMNRMELKQKRAKGIRNFLSKR